MPMLAHFMHSSLDQNQIYSEFQDFFFLIPQWISCVSHEASTFHLRIYCFGKENSLKSVKEESGMARWELMTIGPTLAGEVVLRKAKVKKARLYWPDTVRYDKRDAMIE